MKLYGKDFTRREIEARVGRIEQIGGVRRLAYAEGPEQGVEQIEVRTGGGLSYCVSPQRGLDIGRVEFCGSPLSWLSANGDVHPSHFDARGLEWLRTAAGGMLMTCGMRQAGHPSNDEGEELNLHGRAHHLPASAISAQGEWQGDEYLMTVAGTVRESRIFGENLTLRRTITSRLGENRISIHDEVTNNAFEPSPLMLLYHFNFGFPLLSEKTAITFPSGKVTPRETETPLEGYDAWNSPTAGYSERVYDHSDLKAEKDEATGRQMAEATVVNPDFPAGSDGPRPLRVRLRWDIANLPHLIQWKMPGAGEHVLGIEPANCWVAGRAFEKERGTLKTLAEGESVNFYLELQADWD